MKSLSTIGFNHSPAAYTGTTPPRPILAQHQFDATADGQLLHSVDGKQRALVPPAGFADYVELWPACKPVVDDLRGAERSAAVTTKPAAVKKPAAKKKR